MNYKTKRRSGLTLIELLVVVTIIVLVTAVLAPLLTPALQGREAREAARQISAFFQNARARAKRLGRPVGVVIRRASNNPNLGYQLSMAEELPPLTGASTFSRAKVVFNAQSNANRNFGTATFLYGVTGLELIQPNDFIRFNYRGQKFPIVGLDIKTKTIRFDHTSVPSALISEHNEVPYEIYLRPRQTASTPLELPPGSALILGLSGAGISPRTLGDSTEAVQRALVQEPTDATGLPGAVGLAEFRAPGYGGNEVVPDGLSLMPLTIMFDPSGRVDRIYRILSPSTAGWNGSLITYPPKRPSARIYLFVGKDGVVNPLANLADGSNLWVTIDPTSGATTTSANGVSPDLLALGPQALDPNAVLEPSKIDAMLVKAIPVARQLAATGQSVGGL